MASKPNLPSSEQMARLLAELGRGQTVNAAAAAANLVPSTVRSWISKGRERAERGETDDPLAKFANACEIAHGVGESFLFDEAERLAESSGSGWRRPLRVLELTRKHWSEKQTIEHVDARPAGTTTIHIVVAPDGSVLSRQEARPAIDADADLELAAASEESDT